MAMRCAPKRFTIRSAYRSARRQAGSRQREPNKRCFKPEPLREINGPTTSVAIITVETSVLIPRLARSTESRNIANRINGDATRASTKTKPPNTDDQAGDREEISADDPLDCREGRVECVRQCRQASGFLATLAAELIAGKQWLLPCGLERPPACG